MELVSIIIPTYNRKEILWRAISSTLSQTYENIEVLIIDDCSTDNTQAVVEAIQDPRIKYYCLSVNSGASAARNHGILHAGGKYIAFLDSDDTWHDDKISSQVKLLEDQGDDYGAVYCGVAIAKQFGEPYLNIIPEKQGYIYQDLLLKNWIGSTSVLLVRSDILRQVGGFDVSLPSCQDWDLFIRLSKITKFTFDPRILLNYLDEENTSRITSDKNKVYMGHCAITQKHGPALSKLTRKERAKHYEFLANRMRGTKLYYNAIIYALKAAFISGSVKYVLLAAKCAGSYLKWTLAGS